MTNLPQPTPRQLEILLLLCDDLSRKQIAILLNISPQTVDRHIGHAKERVGVNNIAALIVRVLGIAELSQTAHNQYDASSECAASPSLAAGSSELAGTRTKVDHSRQNV